MEGRKRTTPLNILDTVLDDLCSRFLLNIPSSEKHDMVRLCFQIELAHWFYLDFYRPEDPSLPECRVREFAKLIFERYSFLLTPSDSDIDEVIERWREYKRSVPTYGAVIMDENMEHVLLVQGFVVKSSWGFPKGKVNKDESPDDCAAREVLEETGFDMKPYMNSEEHIQMTINEQITRLYYVVGVPNGTTFLPKTRGEIKSVQWFCLDDLPCHKKDMTPKHNLSLGPNNFFMVIPFVKGIRKWVANQRKKNSALIQSTNGTPVKNKQVTSNQKLEGMTKAQFEQQSTVSVRPIPVLPKEDDDRHREQRQYFSRENNRHLDQILRIKSGKASPQPNKKNLMQNRAKSPHCTSSLPAVGHSYSASRGRGRILHSEAMPDCWKNFKFDKEALDKVIDAFAPDKMKHIGFRIGDN